MKVSALATVSLTALALSAPALGSVKAIFATDFNSLNLASVQDATQYAAGTPGQGGWVTSGGGSSFYNIVNDPVTGGTRGKGMSIQGSSTSTSRYAWLPSVTASGWAARDAGSDQIWATWDQDTSTFNSTSTNRFGLVIWDSTGTKMLAGLYVQVSTGQAYGLSYSTSGTSTANYAYTLKDSSNANLVLTRDAWQSLAVTFNKTTGKTQFFYKSGSNWYGSYVMGAAAGVDPNEVDLYQYHNASTAQGKAYFDNILVTSASGSFVPAPGALTLVGAAGLITSRRRR